MTSWTLDFCSRKLGCCKRSHHTQQSIESTEQTLGFLHLKSIPDLHSPHSISTCLIPFHWSVYVEWSIGNTIGWAVQHPLCMNQPSCSFRTAPLGFKFIFVAKRASLEYAAWPCELSTIISAWYSGPCSLSNLGMIFSWSCRRLWGLYEFQWIMSLTCFTNNSLVQYPS